LPCFAMHAGFSLLGFRVGNFFRDDIEDLEETGNEPGNERVWVQERWCMCTVILDKHRGWLHRRLAWAGREHQNAVCLQESSFGFSFVILARLLAPEHISTEVAYLSFRWSWRPLFNSQKVCLKPNTTFIYCFEYNIYHTMPLFHNNHVFSCACFCSLPIMFEKQLSGEHFVMHGNKSLTCQNVRFPSLYLTCYYNEFIEPLLLFPQRVF
jgi:hypothetical protein